MKRNPILEKRRKRMQKDVTIFVDKSFAIVDRISTILDKQGKTQKDLADAMGKTESEISKWMRGTHNFTLSTISKIEAVLGASVIEAIGENKVYPMEKYINELYEKFNKIITAQSLNKRKIRYEPSIFFSEETYHYDTNKPLISHFFINTKELQKKRFLISEKHEFEKMSLVAEPESNYC